MRNKISISLVLSAAILLLVTTASPLLLFNLQPVQAQTTTLIFRTTEPADGGDACTRNTATITFDAKGTPSSSRPQVVDITNGTFQITSIGDGQILYSGKIYSGRYVNTSGGGEVGLNAQANDVTNNTSGCVSKGDDISIITFCSTLDTNGINVLNSNNYPFATFHGAVECSSRAGGDTTHTTQQSSSITGTTTQDGDRDDDGIPDANDNCSNLPHTRCYKEGNTAIVPHSNR